MTKRALDTGEAFQESSLLRLGGVQLYNAWVTTVKQKCPTKADQERGGGKAIFVASTDKKKHLKKQNIWANFHK